MKPIWKITADGYDITQKISTRLISLAITEEADHKSDKVSIELDDSPREVDDAVLDIPLINTVIEVSLGYEGKGMRAIGTYFIDEISVSPSPRTLKVTGHAAAMGKNYRTPHTQSWHGMTLGKIIEEIAVRNGYESMIDPAVGDIIISHADQHNESDMSFAVRLANHYDAVARPMSNKLVLAVRGTGKSITGTSLPTLEISEKNCSDWSFEYSARKEVGTASGLKSGSGSDQTAAGGATYTNPNTHTDKDDLI
ncbi:phage late control D family protein [Bartonella sp. B17]